MFSPSLVADRSLEGVILNLADFLLMKAIDRTTITSEVIRMANPETPATIPPTTVLFNSASAVMKYNNQSGWKLSQCRDDQ